MILPSGPVTPPAGSALPGLSRAKERTSPARDVQRQEAVVAVVAVVEPALLAAVHGVVGRVAVQHQPRRGQAPPGVDERVDQHVLKLLGVVVDPGVAARPAAGGRVLEPAQRALARQWRAALPACFELARQQRQQRVAAQVVVVVEVLVSQGDAGDALRHHRAHRMFGEAGIAVVRETCGDPVEESGGAVRLPEQQRPGVRRDRSAVERGGHPAPTAPLKPEGNGLTLCRHRSSAGNRFKFMRHINLTSPGDRCLPVGVRNPG